MSESFAYHFSFSSDDAKALWLCIQRAPLPREATDAVATAFLQQLNEQNERLAAQGKLNGAQPAETERRDQ